MTSGITRIALFGNDGLEKAHSVATRLYADAARFGMELFEPENDDFTADIVVCLGGDGTFLDVAGKVGAKEIPILGINIGHLGFLVSYSEEDLRSLLKDVRNGQFEVTNHNVLEVSSDDLELRGYPFALNEVAILKHDVSSMINISASVDGEFLTTYMADGLIVGTPTGSTAYSLSVGGPVIVPMLDAMVLTPVAPHSLNMRPLVIGGDAVVELNVKSRSGSFLISLDGRSHGCRDDVRLKVRKADYKVKVVTHGGRSFFSSLRDKLMWGMPTYGRR